MDTLPPLSGYLPEGINEQEVYLVAAQLLEYALEGAEVEVDRDFMMSHINESLVEHTDKEALAAYYNVFVRTFIGTRFGIEMLLLLVKTEADLDEWFELQSNLPSFKFELLLEEFPNIPFTTIIESVNLMKNERSRLASIRERDCAELFVLDKSPLDRDILDDPEGSEIEDVLVCFHRDHIPDSTPYPSPVASLAIGRSTGGGFIYNPIYRLDMMELDQESPPLTPTVSRYSAKTLDADSPALDYWTVVRTRQTYLSEIVLDEYGDLDDGTGFLGNVITLNNMQVLDADKLDTQYRVINVITQFQYNATGLQTDVSHIYDNLGIEMELERTTGKALEYGANLSSTIGGTRTIGDEGELVRNWSGTWTGSWYGYIAVARYSHKSET